MRLIVTMEARVGTAGVITETSIAMHPYLTHELTRALMADRERDARARRLAAAPHVDEPAPLLRAATRARIRLTTRIALSFRTARTPSVESTIHGAADPG